MPTPAEQAEAMALIARAERARRKAALQAEMNADNAAHDAAMRSSYSYANAFGGGAPASGPQGAARALPAPGPSPTPATAGPAPGGSQLAPWARDLIDYAGTAIGNIPESAERVATGLYEAATDPLGTAEAAGKLLVGTGQRVNEMAGLPEWARIPGGDLGFGDQRATADAAGQALMDRYGGWENLGTTFRDDPVGFGLDLAGVAAPVAGAGRAAMRAGARVSPFPRPPSAPPNRTRPVMSPDDVRVATDAGDAVRETVGRVRGAANEAGRRERGIRDFIANAPTTEALQRAAGPLFEAAKKSGVRFSSAEFGPFRKKLTRRLREEGADPVLHPKIARLVGMIEDAPPGVSPDMGNLMILRRQFGAAAGDADPDTRRLGVIGQELLDDFVESGSASASGAMKEANRLWARMRKSETIERAIAKAETAQQGLEAGLRAEFKSIYRGILDKNKKYRGFTPEETAAIKAVAQGNITSNVLRRIASLSGGSGPQRAMQNLIQGGAAGGGIGFALGGAPGAAVGALVGPVAGQVAGRMATRATQRRANLARAMAARGQTPAQARRGPQDSTLAELMSGYMEASP